GEAMKILIYGAGPMGSHMAARLHEAGADVTLLARGSRLAQLRNRGVILEDAMSGRRETHKVPTTAGLDPEDPYDLIVVAMRKSMARNILPILAGHRGSGTILFLMNNAAGPGEWVETLGAERVMVGIPTSGGYREGEVMRILAVPHAPLPIGEVDGRRTERAQAVAEVLGAMKDTWVQVRSDMDAYLVSHVGALAGNMGLFAAGLDPTRFARTRDAIVLGLRAQEEAFRAQEAAGIPVRPSYLKALTWIPEPLLAAGMRPVITSTFFEVGLLGHARVARDEIEELLADFRMRVAHGGVPTPCLDRLEAHLTGGRGPLPQGQKDIPLRWAGTLGLAAGVAAGVGLGLLARKRLRGG
ncbi:MAG: ketopantoate reductase family protein, partial [Gemmatimonadales bacterium]